MSLLPFKKILAPVDFSDHASRSLASAAELATHFAARLHVLHVVAPVPLMESSHGDDFGLGAPMGPAGGMDIGVYQQQLVDTSRNSLEKLVRQAVSVDTDVAVLTEVGDAANIIVDFADRQKIDCIVMATHGLTGLSHLLMGSVAEKVVRHATVPVLIVRRQAEKP